MSWWNPWGQAQNEGAPSPATMSTSGFQFVTGGETGGELPGNFFEGRKRSISVLCFSWNSQSIAIPVAGSPVFAEERQYFLTELNKRIQHSRPDVLFFASQESDENSDYLHYDVLGNEMAKLRYRRFGDVLSLMGVGVTTLATGHRRGLRSSLFIEEKYFDHVLNHNANYRSLLQKTHSVNWKQSKGAAFSYIYLPGFGLTCFVNTHLDFNAKSLILATQTNDVTHRMQVLHKPDNQFLDLCRRARTFPRENLLEEQVGELQAFFVMGDTNYRVLAKSQYPYNNTQDYHTRFFSLDELRFQARTSNIYQLSEGINGVGPQFMPTCKLRQAHHHGADPNKVILTRGTAIGDYNIGKYRQRYPSWCDRILFYSEKADIVLCTSYDRFDAGITTRSDHAAVYATFELEDKSSAASMMASTSFY